MIRELLLNVYLNVKYRKHSFNLILIKQKTITWFWRGAPPKCEWSLKMKNTSYLDQLLVWFMFHILEMKIYKYLELLL